MLRVRTLSRLGVDVLIGIGPSITVAATASSQVLEPGGVLAVTPGQAAHWLAPLPVEALHGVGPRQPGTLHEYGIHTAGLLAAVSPATVQRLLGGKAGRTAADRARGIDPRPVVPRTLPSSATVHRSFDRQEGKSSYSSADDDPPPAAALSLRPRRRRGPDRPRYSCRRREGQQNEALKRGADLVARPARGAPGGVEGGGPYDDHVTARRTLGSGPEGFASVGAAQADLLDGLPGVRLPDLAELRARGVLGARTARPSAARRVLGAGGTPDGDPSDPSG